MKISSNNNAKVAGYALGIIAAATYGMNPLFALPLYSDGMDSNSVLLFRYLFAVPIVALMAVARGRSLRLRRNEIMPLAGLGLIMALSSLALFMSYLFMAASIASTLLFVYPLMVALIMALVYKERLTVQTIVCLVLALGGLYVLFTGNEEGPLSVPGTLWVMASALLYAIYIVGVNRPGMKHISTLSLTFWVLLFGVALFIVVAAVRGEVTVPRTPWLWLNLVSLALLPTAVSLICTTMAIQRIGSTPTAILGVFEPVTAILIGLMVFGEVLTGTDAIGIILIVVAVGLEIAGGGVATQLLKIRKLLPKLRIRHIGHRKD